MISLTCTHCQTVLSIDDAFAGGVCRCQHCGTIQTVPSHLKSGATVNAGVGEGQPVGAGQKALYQSHRGGLAGRAEDGGGVGSGTGLEDLADVVASSGLGGSGLSSSIKARKAQRRSVDSAVAAPAGRSKTPLLAAGGAVLALAIAVAIWWITSAGSKPVVTSPQQSTNGDVVAPAGPNFCGVQLSGSSVVYLLDRGDSAKEVFDAMKEATYKSIESLGPDRKFQVLLWDNNTGDAGFPNTSTTFATKENLEACRKQLEDITAQHQSTVHGPLARAVSENPDSIVVMTAKGFELDDAFQSDVESVVKGSPVKLYTISIQNESQADCKPLQTLAKESGGTYKSLSAGAMQAAIGD
jgi:hypothetical protein